MRVIAIDPGYQQSAWVTVDAGRVVAHGIEANEHLRSRFGQDSWAREGFGDGPFYDSPVTVVFEQIESFGMAVGREVFETVFWTGRLFEAARRIGTAERMPRRTIKLHLCGHVRAQDSNVRMALMDRYGGQEAAIGKKKTPGPLYGIKSHEWSALAIAVTWTDQQASALAVGI